MTVSTCLFDRLGGRLALIRLLNHFYADVRQHRVIGPIFESQIEDWPEHIENIADFWTQITGGPTNYSGRMPARHIPLGLREEHFQAWLGLWEINCRNWAPTDCADELVAHARQIALRLREFCGVPQSFSLNRKLQL
ncbi:MAG TPA: group III truncated hemoglobin [Verrucomicrobiae bacterium]|jgi:hemoglobin